MEQQEQNIDLDSWLAANPETHLSDCALHNLPAYPAGECNCGAPEKTEKYLAVIRANLERIKNDSKLVA